MCISPTADPHLTEIHRTVAQSLLSEPEWKNSGLLPPAQPASSRLCCSWLLLLPPPSKPMWSSRGLLAPLPLKYLPRPSLPQVSCWILNRTEIHRIWKYWLYWKMSFVPYSDHVSMWGVLFVCIFLCFSGTANVKCLSQNMLRHWDYFSQNFLHPQKKKKSMKTQVLVASFYKYFGIWPISRLKNSHFALFSIYGILEIMEAHYRSFKDLRYCKANLCHKGSTEQLFWLMLLSYILSRVYYIMPKANI